MASPPSIDLDAARRIARELAKSVPAKGSNSILRKESLDGELARRLQPDGPMPGPTVSRSPTIEERLARSMRRGAMFEVRMVLADGTVLMKLPGGMCVAIPPNPDLPATVGVCMEF